MGLASHFKHQRGNKSLSIPVNNHLHTFPVKMNAKGYCGEGGTTSPLRQNTFLVRLRHRQRAICPPLNFIALGNQPGVVMLFWKTVVARGRETCPRVTLNSDSLCSTCCPRMGCSLNLWAYAISFCVPVFSPLHSASLNLTVTMPWQVCSEQRDGVKSAKRLEPDRSHEWHPPASSLGPVIISRRHSSQGCGGSGTDGSGRGNQGAVDVA